MACALLVACAAAGDARAPIESYTVAAPRPGAERTLVVVLPGYADRARDLRKNGIAPAIQAAWPHADVLLADATFAYYRDRTLVTRLHEDVIAPARRAGYRRVWVAGASMGGLGALLYEHEHPGALDGIVLFAPFLGDKELIEEIRRAGGVRQWAPGPLPEGLNRNTYQRQIWHMVQGWAARPETMPAVWIACGSDDYLLPGARLLAAALPPGRFLEAPGEHAWRTWTGLATAVFSRIGQAGTGRTAPRRSSTLSTPGPNAMM